MLLRLPDDAISSMLLRFLSWYLLPAYFIWTGSQMHLQLLRSTSKLYSMAKVLLRPSCAESLLCEQMARSSTPSQCRSSLVKRMRRSLPCRWPKPRCEPLRFSLTKAVVHFAGFDNTNSLDHMSVPLGRPGQHAAGDDFMRHTSPD